MARPRASGSWPRVLNPSYYLRRPRRLILLFVFFVCTTFMLWDRHSLVLHHERTVGKLSEQNFKLSRKLEDLTKFIKEKGEDLPKDIDAGESEDKEEGPGRDATTQQHILSETKGQFAVQENDDPVAVERREKVKAAMLHAWSSYEKYAWGFDELQPVSKRGANQFGGLGATIVDSLDTLYIMGFQEQFNKARDWVAENMNFNKNYDASVFETTIRVLGGLLSSFDLTGEQMFLKKAQELADHLLPAWSSSPTGIPYTTINLASGHASNPGWTGGSSVLADLGTEQLEFIGLSQRTGNPKYKEKVEKVIKQLKKVFPSDGLLPIYVSPDSGQPTTSRITFGAMGDSFYEYLLKVWVLGNKTEVVKHYREMWEQSMEGMMGLVMKSNPSSYTYLAERQGSIVNKVVKIIDDTDDHNGNKLMDSIKWIEPNKKVYFLFKKMDELACFAPGMLTLGTEGASPEKAEKYLNLAKELARTCYNMYMSTPTKLAGENYQFVEGRDMVVGSAYNILRPETIESLMYLWRKTGDSKYRDWGWDIFQAFEAQSRTPTGYVGLRDVNSGEKDDMMQSFFLAETLKYLYLLFSPSSVIPLDQWVFNTEAHPLRIIPRVNEPTSLEDNPDAKASDTQTNPDTILAKLKGNSLDRKRQRRRGRREGRERGSDASDY